MWKNIFVESSEINITLFKTTVYDIIYFTRDKTIFLGLIVEFCKGFKISRNTFRNCLIKSILLVFNSLNTIDNLWKNLFCLVDPELISNIDTRIFRQLIDSLTKSLVGIINLL